MLKSRMYKDEIMVDKSTRSIADKSPREDDKKTISKEKKEFLLSDMAVMDEIVSNLMKDLKLL